MLTDAAPREAHEAHEPGEADGQDEQRVLGPLGHLAPSDLPSRLGAAEHRDIDANDAKDAYENGQDLVDREADPHDSADEVSVDSVEGDHAAETMNNAACTMVPVRAQVTTGFRFARR